MKKHFILTSLFAFTVIVNAHTETLVSADLQTPGISFETTYSVAEQPAGVFCDDCDKCHKGKKSKKQDTCGKPGKHYGKHKNRGKHHGSSNNSCNNRKSRDCGDGDRWGDRDCRDGRDDRRSDRNRRDNRDDGWGNDNRQDRRDVSNRRSTSTRQNRDSGYRTKSRSAQRRDVATGQQKTGRTGTTRKPGSRL